MMTARFMALTVASAVLAGCAFDLGETVATDVDVLSFSDVATEGDALALTGTPATEENLQEAGADLFSALFAPTASSTTPAAPGHRFGEPVPYGEIKSVCDAPRGRLGTKIANAGGFTIYDSNPGSTQMRAHYITGFDDRCARQFSAALTLTGDVGTHEVVRYLPSNRVKFNGTDSAYEAIKASYCRVRHGKPCGSRLDALARQTTFITAYQSFGSRPQWVEILLHDGEMTAIDFKTN